MNPTLDQCAKFYVEGYVHASCFLQQRRFNMQVLPKFATQLIHLQFPRFDVSPSMQAMGAKLLRTRFRKTPRAGLSQHTPASLTWRPTDLYVDRKFEDAGSNLRVQVIQKEYQLQFSLHRCVADGIMKYSPGSSSKVFLSKSLSDIRMR